MAWEIVLVQEVHEWFMALEADDAPTASLVDSALAALAETGPSLGRPLVDSINHSRLSNLKELRPGSMGRSEIRILFVFDPDRQAVLLVAGDKSGRWQQWYRTAVPLAEERYERWLLGHYAEEIVE